MSIIFRNPFTKVWTWNRKTESLKIWQWKICNTNEPWKHETRAYQNCREKSYWFLGHVSHPMRNGLQNLQFKIWCSITKKSGILINGILNDSEFRFIWDFPSYLGGDFQSDQECRIRRDFWKELKTNKSNFFQGSLFST